MDVVRTGIQLAFAYSTPFEHDEMTSKLSVCMHYVLIPVSLLALTINYDKCARDIYVNQTFFLNLFFISFKLSH